MERKFVTENELLSYLNKELAKKGQHADCHFDSIVRMKIDDRTGCNWASATIKGSAAVGHLCPPDAERIVNEAKMMFNVKD